MHATHKAGKWGGATRRSRTRAVGLTSALACSMSSVPNSAATPLVSAVVPASAPTVLPEPASVASVVAVVAGAVVVGAPVVSGFPDVGDTVPVKGFDGTGRMFDGRAGGRAGAHGEAGAAAAASVMTRVAILLAADTSIRGSTSTTRRLNLLPVAAIPTHRLVPPISRLDGQVVMRQAEALSRAAVPSACA